jgi:pyrroloquinoline quinone (PQQ) biosynthesis protein C
MTSQPKADVSVNTHGGDDAVKNWVEEVRGLIDENRWTRSEIIRAIVEGRASRDAIKRWAMEYRYYSSIATPNAFVMLANAPDRQTYAAWGRNMAGELGYLEEPEHLMLLAELPKQFGASEDEIAAYEPLATTIGAAFTVSYYFRRSFEEGIAAGVASENMAVDAMEAIYDGLKNNYGVDSQFFKVHIAAEQEHAEMGLAFLSKHAATDAIRERMQRAILNTCVTKRQMWVGCETFLK